VAVPPSLHMCRSHWYTLQKHLRDLIWRHYVPGQEIKKNPTPAYMEAFRAARDWALRYELRKKEQETVLQEISRLGQEIQPNDEDQIMTRDGKVREQIAKEIYERIFDENGNLK
jgi:hypothetical protein